MGSTGLLSALWGTLLLTMPLAGESAAADRHVDRNNTTATADGSALRPYRTVQAALDAAATGDAVLVARGTYTENVRIDGRRIALRGGYAGASSAQYAANVGGDFSTQLPTANVTIIQASEATAAVVLLLDPAASGSLVDGFTIRGGSHGIELDTAFTFPLLDGVTITHNILENNGVADYSHFGGGLSLSGTNHLVADNAIRNNVGGRGAGAALCCDDITFERNRVEGNVGYGDHGGGINQVGTGVLRYNVIRGNRIGEGLGYGWGGGMLVLGTPRLSYNVYTENHAPSVGGAVFMDDGARAILEHEVIFNNTAATGAAVYLDGYGEDVFSTAELRHCTIAGNTASESPLGNAVYITGGSSATVYNSIAWNNQGDDFEVDERSSISVTFTLNEEGVAGAGNLSADPLFASASDFHLRSTAGRFDPAANGGAGGFVVDGQHSPAIDAGDPAAPFADEPQPNGGRVNLGAYGNTGEASKSGGTLATATATASPAAATPTRTATPGGGGATRTATPTRPATATPTPSGIPALNTYYVAPDGDDGGPGSQAQPWRTLQKAGDTATAGTDVIVLPGTYAGVRVRASGRADAPIRFRAQPGVVIDTSGPANANGDNVWLRNVSYVEIDGFEVRDADRAGIAVQGEPDANIAGVVVRNCRCLNNGRWGIFTAFAGDLLIEGNETAFSRDEHGIYVSNSADRIVVRDNRTHHNSSSGIQLNADPAQRGDDPNDPQGDGIIEDAVIERNVIYDNGAGGAAGINLASVRRSLVRNNLLYDNHATGIAGWDDDEGSNQFGTRDNRIVGNTIVQADDGRFAVSLVHGSTGNTVENNILVHRGTRGSLEVDASSRPGLRSDYNVVVDVFSDDEEFLDLAAWRALGLDANSLVASPSTLFADQAAGDYRLAADSPAVDRGTPNVDLPADITGRARPQGAGVDIGAYESAAGGGTCAGDCNGDGQVLVNELIVGVSVLLGNGDLEACSSIDGDGNGVVAVNELVAGVRSALDGCPA
jgi:hypothetical protein